MRKVIILTLSFCCLSQNYLGQTVQDVRKCKFEAITLLEKYATTCVFASGINPDDEFYSIFKDSAEIYNDILFFNEKQYISPKEYYEIFVNLTKMGGKFNLRKDEIQLTQLNFPTKEENGNWKIVTEINKTFQITTPYNWKYPEWTFVYEIIIESSSDFKTSKITKITPKEPLKDFFIIKLNDGEVKDENLKGVYYKGVDLIDLNSENSRIFDESAYNIEDIRMKLDDDYYYKRTKDTQDMHRYFFSIFPKKFILGLGVNSCPYSLGKRMSDENKVTFNDISFWSFEIGVNASLAYLLKNNSNTKSKWLLKSAINYSFCNIHFRGNNHIEYPSTDSDLDEYQRRIWLTKIRENIHFHSFGLPVGFIFNQTLPQKINHKNAHLSIEFGGFVQYYYANTSKSRAASTYKGYYDNLFQLEMDRYYDYGYYALKSKATQLIPNTWDYGIYAGIGLSFNLTAELLIQLDLTYKHGFSNRTNLKNSYYLSENSTTYNSLFYALNKNQTQNFFLGATLLKKF